MKNTDIINLVCPNCGEKQTKYFGKEVLEVMKILMDYLDEEQLRDMEFFCGCGSSYSLPTEIKQAQ